MDLLLYIIFSFLPWDLLWKDSKEMTEAEGKMKESMSKKYEYSLEAIKSISKRVYFFLSMHYGPYHVSQTQFTPYIQ